MRRLILMRHGEAERLAPGLEDFDRDLDDEGREESRCVGMALAQAGFAPDLGLVSAAKRTLETWLAMTGAFPGARMETDEALYGASAPRLAAAVDLAAAGAATLMVVGHNPGIHHYAAVLARAAGSHAKSGRPFLERFPTGSAAAFAFEPDGRPRFERLFLARDYRSDRR